MTIKELIIELQKHDENKEVMVEGCDCMGEATGVDELSIHYKDEESKKRVIIRRKDGEFS